MAKKIIQLTAEKKYANELKALAKFDKEAKPANWKLSPQAVVTFLLGGTLDEKNVISPKYFGDRRLIEMAVATLLTDRALLLTGIPGTAKSRVSEHLAAAISGQSTLLIQGTSGIHEDAIRYGWNYAQLLSKGPSKEAIVPSPVLTAMEKGMIVRVEEMTRIPSDVQDSLITVLSEKMLPIPELNTYVQAKEGFNLIATANDKDKGINDLSSALRRRFNTVRMPLPATLEAEVDIVAHRVKELGETLSLPAVTTSTDEIKRLVTIFRELRTGQTIDGQMRLKSPSGTLSTAEAISVVNNGLALASYFGDGKLTAKDLVPSLINVVIKDKDTDKKVWQEYAETVIRQRNGWQDLYEAYNSNK